MPRFGVTGITPFQKEGEDSIVAVNRIQAESA
jgi:hypothetical protein